MFSLSKENWHRGNQHNLLDHHGDDPQPRDVEHAASGQWHGLDVGRRPPRSMFGGCSRTAGGASLVDPDWRRRSLVRSSPVARSGGFVIDAVGPTRGQAGAEHLGQHRTKDRRGEHQHEDRIEHVTVEQALAAGVERVVGNQRRGECAATCGSVNDQTVSVASRV